MSSIIPVTAIPASLLERALHDPRVVEAAKRANVPMDTPAQLAALLAGVPVQKEEQPAQDAFLNEPSLFDTVHSKRPADAIRAYQQVALYQ